MLQIIALITMLVDHLGLMFYPDKEILRWIGRLAFPIYAYGLLQGYLNTSNVKKYFIRLFLIAAAAELPYIWAFKSHYINVVGTFIVCLGVLWLLDQWNSKRWAQVGITLSAAFLLEYIPFEYGAYALFLILIYRYVKSERMLLIHVALNLVFLFYKGWIIQLGSILATVILIYASARVKERVVPAWIWRSFYPAHLLFLAIVQVVIK